MAKKYYWLQLKEDFFRQKEIKLLRRIAGGDTYTIIYLKMMLLSLKDEGKLFYEGVGNTFAEEIALEIDEDIENVEVTINYLITKNLIKVEDFEGFEGFMTEVPSLIGSETDSARRVRKHRELKANRNQKLPSNEIALQSNNEVTKGNTDIEIDIKKDIELEQESYINQEKKNEDDNDYSNSPAHFFENNGFGTISPHIRDRMNGIYDDFLTIDAQEKDIQQLIIKSLERAIEYNARSWAYAEKILIRWHNKGYKTVADVDASEKQFQASKNKGVHPLISEEVSKETEELLERSRKRLAEEVANTHEEDFSLFR